MNVHVTNKTSKLWEVVYVIKVRQLFSKRSQSDCFVRWVVGGTNKMLFCAVM